MVRLRLEEVTSLTTAVLDEVERAVVGKRAVLELLLVGMLARGHVLLEDVPGVAKTLIARSFASVLGLDFARVQFTPDLLPSDVTGSSIFDPSARELGFRPGPLFANLVLGDEINRAPPKTQSALLEAMAERQVTADGVTHALPQPFLVVATQNPIEFDGTYALPEAQLDRFLFRLSVGYPDEGDELEMLSRRAARRSDRVDLRPVVDRPTFQAMQDAVEDVHVDRRLQAYIIAVVAATRRHPGLELGASPRGSLGLLAAARALAVVRRRDFATPEDVKALAEPCLAHRLVLRPEQWVRGTRTSTVLAECLDTVPLVLDGEPHEGGTEPGRADPRPTAVPERRGPSR